MPELKREASDRLYKLLKPILNLPDSCLAFKLDVEYAKPVLLTTTRIVTYEEEDQEVITKTSEVHLEEETTPNQEQKL